MGRFQEYGSRLTTRWSRPDQPEVMKCAILALAAGRYLDVIPSLRLT